MDSRPARKKAPSLWDLAQLARARKAASVEVGAGGGSSGSPPNRPPPSSTTEPAGPQSIPADAPRNVAPIASPKIKNEPTKPSPSPVENSSRPNVDASPPYATVRAPSAPSPTAPPTAVSRESHTAPPIPQPTATSSRTGTVRSSIPYNVSTIPSNLPPKPPASARSPETSAPSPKRRPNWDPEPAPVHAQPPPTSRDTDHRRDRLWPEISPPSSRSQPPDVPRNLEYVHPSRFVQYSAPAEVERPRSYREPFDEHREYDSSRRGRGGRGRGTSRGRGTYIKDERRSTYHQDECRPSYRQDEREPGWNQWVSSDYTNGVNPANPTGPAAKRTRWDPALPSAPASPRDTDVHRRVSFPEGERRTSFPQEQRRPSFTHDERRRPYHQDERRRPGSSERPDDRALNLLRPPPQNTHGRSEQSSQEEGEIREHPTSHGQESLPTAPGFRFQILKRGTPSRSPSPPKRQTNPLLNRPSPTPPPPLPPQPSTSAPPQPLTPSTPLFANSTSFAPTTSETVKPITAAALSSIRIKKRKPRTPTPPTAPTRLDPSTEASLYERRPAAKRSRTTPLPTPTYTRFYDRNPKPFTRTHREMWLDILRDLRTLQTHPAREIDWARLREHFQTAPYTPIDDNLHTKVHDILRGFVAAGPSIVCGNDDIFLDAKYLYTKWARGDDTTSIMRGVQTKKRPGKAWSDSFDPSFVQLRRQADYIGEGELVCGQWWPKQMCCMFDGAHGSHEAGITAIPSGAVSVVLSGGHNNEYEDIDELDIVRYCGTKGVRDPHGGDIGVKSSATQSLFDAMGNHQPVRLIRSFKSKGKERQGAEVIAPLKGFRYDGLYDVTEVETLSERFAMYRFVLRRQAGQVPVRYKGVGKKPNAQDLLNWNREENMGVEE